MLMPMLLLAAPVKKDAAKAIASAFLKKQLNADGKMRAPQQLSLVSNSPEDAAYYVFNNASGDGYVMVAGDDAIGDLIGYSDQGSFDEANMPEALRAILNDYSKVVKFAHENNLPMHKAPRKADRKDVKHFVNFAWDQSGKYAENCPAASGSDDKHCSTGCMAVTTGMIVAYYKYPETLPGVYNNNVSSSEQVSGEAWSPDYTNFKSTYYTYTAAGDMPKFMRHIADALNTNYSAGGSGAQAPSFKTAMVNFGYDPAMRTVQRDAMSQADWDELMYQEVAAGRPVFLYGDHNQLGGHSYLTDGYQASTGFFYINWGWGGTCNGWFDMGILNPFVSYFSSWGGMGYDCPPAGFTGGLKAVIGIQKKPEDAVEAVELLTIDNMRHEGNRVVATYFNYNQNSYTGQVAWAELNADNTFSIVENTVENLNSMSNYKTKNLDYTALNLPEGYHTFVLVCKKSDAEEYNLCEGYNHAYAEIMIEGGNTTVKAHPVKDVVVENVNYYGTTGPKADQYYEVIVTMRNNGDDIYKSVKINGTRNDGVKVGGSSMNIGFPAGETKTFSLFFDKGAEWSSLNDYSFDLNIYFDNDIIWTGTVLMKDQMAYYTKYTDVEFEDYEYVDNKAMLYSTALKGNINIKNETTRYVFNDAVRITLKDKDGNIVGQSMQRYVVDKNVTQAYPVDFTGLKSGEKYYLTCEALESKRVGSTYSYKAAETYLSDFEITVMVGIPYYTEKGTLERYIINDDTTTPVALPETSAAVDLTKFSADMVDLSSITNPNCIYFLKADAEVPAAINGKNVVKGNEAEKITLVDGYPIAIPVDFTAQEAAYTRTFTKGNNGNDQGWTTIVVPFDAKATVDGQNVDWFRSKSESGRKFWLYKYNGGVGGTVYFDYETGNVIKGNEPYLIAVPGDKWGPTYDLRKEFVFKGTNVAFSKDAPALEKDDYTFVGLYGKKELTDHISYKMNEAGDFFELVTTEGVYEMPFHAYFSVLGAETANKAMLRIVQGENPNPTGIEQVETLDDINNAVIYNLNGQRVARPVVGGIYIVNGKKVVIK